MIDLNIIRTKAMSYDAVSPSDALVLCDEIERLRKEVSELRSVICDELTAEAQRLGFYPPG
jgi:hypothetical protein